MDDKQSRTVKVEQLLFGYEDGHRLLASSFRITPEERADLLPLSDLASGVRINEIESYWTGMPLPKMKHYALMKTWPAPEMPRPGCVWTHVLLIAFSDLANLYNLDDLRDYFLRPSMNVDREAYSLRLLIQAENTHLSGAFSKPKLDINSCRRVLRATYSQESNPISGDQDEELDTAIFAVWSQQWPRLRRTFSFRTAGSLEDVPGYRVDLQVISGALRYSNKPSSSVDLEVGRGQWELAAIDDLFDADRSTFRSFIWRYGSDIKRGRERFIFLADLYVMSRRVNGSEERQEQLLNLVVNTLTEAEDGRTLKEDVASFEHRNASQMPTISPIVLVKSLIRLPDKSGFPQPSDDMLQKVVESQLGQMATLLQVSRLALQQTTEFSRRYIYTIAHCISGSIAVEIAQEEPELFLRVVAYNPDLIDLLDFYLVPTPLLIDALKTLPNESPNVDRVVERLLQLDSSSVADYIVRRSPDVLLHKLAGRVKNDTDISSVQVQGVWLNAVASQASSLFRSGLLMRLRYTSDLAMFASVLGYLSPVVREMGPKPWADALANTIDDVRGFQRQMFLTFLLSLALADPYPGCEPLFEKAFEAVHEELWSSRLPHQASVLLDRYLPEVRWWQQWDTCLRLRMAVVNAYLHGSLKPSSFVQLTEDNHLYGRLLEAFGNDRESKNFQKLVYDKKA